MSTLTNSHIRRVPTQHRITVMETPEDQHYYGRTYDNYPDQDGNVKLPTGEYTSVTVPLMGLYLVEELESGRPSGRFDLLTHEQFKEQYIELGDPGLEYGYRAVGGRNIFFHPMNPSIEEARRGLASLQEMHPLGKFEVLSRPAGSGDEWTVVGR
jgi:hypothetical protein